MKSLLTLSARLKQSTLHIPSFLGNGSPFNQSPCSIMIGLPVLSSFKHKVPGAWIGSFCSLGPWDIYSVGLYMSFKRINTELGSAPQEHPGQGVKGQLQYHRVGILASNKTKFCFQSRRETVINMWARRGAATLLCGLQCSCSTGGSITETWRPTGWNGLMLTL